jgi:hypothetical protein
MCADKGPNRGRHTATTAAASRKLGPSSSDTLTTETFTGEELDENEVVRVDVQLITVPVVVRDQTGRSITGLTASSFRLYEDKRQEQIATFATSDAPFEVALLLDTCGSTREEMKLIRIGIPWPARTGSLTSVLLPSAREIMQNRSTFRAFFLKSKLTA